MPAPRPRPVIGCLVATAGVAALYLAVCDLAGWPMDRQLFWVGLLVILFVGIVCENAVTLDALRVTKSSNDASHARDLSGRTAAER